MSFLEKDLVLNLQKHLVGYFNTDQSFSEINLGYGIADLVFTPNFNFRKERLNKRISVTDLNEIQILLSLRPNKKYNLEEVYVHFAQIDKNKIRKYLKSLIEAGLITKISKETFRPLSRKEQLSPIPEVIAIEAKLTDYKSGFIQALRYQYFADKTYVALLNTVESKVPIQEYQSRSVGVIFYDQDLDSIKIFEPKSKSKRQQFNINFFAKEILMSKYSQRN